jgi:hypothetical protein
MTVGLGLWLFVGLMLLALSPVARRVTTWGLVVGPTFGLWAVAATSSTSERGCPAPMSLTRADRCSF